MIIVELPDGKKAKFPDGTSEEQIKQALASEGLFKQQTPFGGQGPGTFPGGFAAQLPESDVPEIFTGEKRTRQAEQEFGGPLPPETPKNVPDELRGFENAAGTGLAKLFFTDDEFTNLMLSIDPGAKAEKFGDATVITLNNGEQFTVNRPGLTASDVLKGIGFGGLFGAAFKLLARQGGKEVLKRNIVRETLRQGTGQAATEAGRQAIAIDAGARERLGLPEIAASGAVGGAIPGIGGTAARIAARGRGALFQAGQATERGQRILKKAGVDSLSNDAKILLNSLQKRGATEEQLIEVAKRARIPVSETGASITGDPNLALLERQALAGKLDDPAADLARQLQKEQVEQLAKGTEETARGIGGGAGIDDVQAALIRRKQIAKRNVDRRFDIAREAGGGIKTEGIQSVRDDFLRIADEFGVSDTREVKNLLKFIDKELAGGKVIPLKRVMDARQRINNMISKKADRAEDAALITMKAALDKGLEDSLDNALFTGGKVALKAWRKALNSRVRFARTFESKDVIADLTKILPDGTGRLAVTPDEAANYLFGRGRLGLKRGLEKDLKKLRELLPDEQWNAIREGAFRRFLRNTEPGDFPSSFKRELEQGLRESPEVFKTLFTKGETNLLRQIATQAERVKEGLPVSSSFIFKFNKSFGQRFVKHLEELPLLGRAMSHLFRDIRGNLAERSLLPGESTILFRANRPSQGLAPVAGGAQFLRSRFGDRER